MSGRGRTRGVRTTIMGKASEATEGDARTKLIGVAETQKREAGLLGVLMKKARKAKCDPDHFVQRLEICLQ